MNKLIKAIDFCIDPPLEKELEFFEKRFLCLRITFSRTPDGKAPKLNIKGVKLIDSDGKEYSEKKDGEGKHGIGVQMSEFASFSFVPKNDELFLREGSEFEIILSDLDGDRKFQKYTYVFANESWSEREKF